MIVLEDKLELSKAAIINVFEAVFPEKLNDLQFYLSAKGRTAYKTWRACQLSDHLPMWIELRTDFTARYLRQKMRRLGLPLLLRMMSHRAPPES